MIVWLVAIFAMNLCAEHVLDIGAISATRAESLITTIVEMLRFATSARKLSVLRTVIILTIVTAVKVYIVMIVNYPWSVASVA